MNDINTFIDFNQLEYGSYWIPNEYEELTENVKYQSAVFNRLYFRKVRLPEGRNNIIYLLSPTFDSGINLISNERFIRPLTYKRIFYPIYTVGTFMGKRYLVNVSNKKKDRNSIITSRTKLIQYQGRNIIGNTDNVFFMCCDIFNEFSKIMKNRPIKRNYMEFYKGLTNVILPMAPKKNDTFKGSQHNNRILIIDADNFGFSSDTKFEEAKTNPLFLLYLAFLRNRDLSSLNIDLDMLICSGSMFMKFNPATCTSKEWSKFRQALFRIVKANLDDYTESLEDEEKEELQDTKQDQTISSAVEEAIKPYVKQVSGSTKQLVRNIVEEKLRKNMKVAATKNTETVKAQQDISNEILKNVTGNPSWNKFKVNKTTHSVSATTSPTQKQSSFRLSKPLKGEPSKKQLDLFQRVAGGYQSLATKSSIYANDDDDDLYSDSEYERPDDLDDTEEDEIENDAKDILVTDDDVKEEILEEIQKQNVPTTKKHTPINSKRDAKLREEQKKVVVNNETIEEILSRDSSRVPIQESDKSNVLHTSNPNVKKIRFANFDKTYIDELMMKDIVSCFDFLKDLEYPFYVTACEVRDTSNSLNFKDTWTVSLRDETNKRYTIKVDIPKFQNYRFMLIEGTRYVISKQNFYNPLVKDTPDSVMLTTNFNKVQMNRVSTRSLSSVEKIFGLMKKVNDSQMFQGGDSSKLNMSYISSLEYDEFSNKLFIFKSKTCQLYFSREYIKENLEIPSDVKGNEFFIGYEGNNPVIINEDTGLDRSGRTISDIIEANLPDDYLAIYKSVKAPKQSMYVQGKLAGEFIPIITTLCVWVGLTEALNLMNIHWKFDTNVKRLPPQTSSKKYIKFADGVLEYEPKTFAELILNGLNPMHPEKFKFDDFNSEAGYGSYIYSQFGTYGGITELKTFYEFLIDPITKEVCHDLNLPDTAPGLLIHGVKLLSDNTFVSKANDNSYRVRCIETIPAILYSCLATQYKAHVKSGRRLPMTLKQNCIIQALQKEKTVEAYSTLNPVLEMNAANKISTKGFRGSNSDFSYDEEKRSYDPTAIGKLAITSDPNAGVGINRQLTVEPTIANARGYREPVEDVNQLEDVQVFSPVELMTPGTIRGDDAIRSAIAGKQSGHIMPTKDAVPSLVSNGFDETVQFYLSDDFVINAEEDGKVIAVDENTGFVVVEYKSGKTKAINTKPDIVKNSGGGFYLSNKLKVVHTKVGETFKKDEPLAYHEKYFRYSPLSGLRFTLGPIAKAALMSTYNTYEDAGVCTQAFAEKMATHVVYRETGMFKRNNNILYLAKIGDHVNIGDPLIKFNVSVEDDELSKYLSKLNEENAELLENESKSDVKASHAGEIVDIKVYSLLAPEVLSESLGKIVQDYFDKGINKKEFLNKFDQTDSTMKAGYLLTDSTEPVKNRYNAIKGIKGIDVLIEIYIQHEDILGVGDKVALYGPNKQIISEVIEPGYEGYAESTPDEPIDILVPPGAISRRMTISTTKLLSWGKCSIELKKRLKEMIKWK